MTLSLLELPIAAKNLPSYHHVYDLFTPETCLHIFFCLVEYQEFPETWKQVEVGPYGVWVVNSEDNIYKKTPTGWQQVPGSLKDISVGKNSVWGNNLYDDIFKRVGGGDWQHVHGKLKQV